jgi:SSS family solute:Na+ symporter
MSTISSGMNASATVFSVDIYKRYFKPGINDKQMLRLLHVATVIFGVGGMAAAIAIIGVSSVLDVWWQLSGIFAGGMLGLFLLALISRQTKNHEAIIAAIIGSLVILWLTFPSVIPLQYSALRNTLNTNMTIVIGTLVILLVGIVLTKIKENKKQRAVA